MVARFQTLLLRLCLFLAWRPLPGKSLTFSIFRTCTPGGPCQGVSCTLWKPPMFYRGRKVILLLVLIYRSWFSVVLLRVLCGESS